MADILTFGDQLQVEGVNFKGFGILPKYVMLDRDLTLEAKTIYAYFCSYAGNGSTTFPGRVKILSDLPMSKSGYYKHFRLLTEQGYLRVMQNKTTQKRFSKNVYTLVSNPKKFQDTPDLTTQNPVYSQIWFDGLKSVGYGIIPKSVMLDPRLPLKAKGIYAYFCSFTGSGKTAFPPKKQILYHLGISEKTYYKFYDMLTACNYIRSVQRHKGGRLQVNDYILCDNPNRSENAHTVLKIAPSQDSSLQDTELLGDHLQDSNLQDTEIQDGNLQDTKLQDTRKQDTNINKENINNSNKNNSLTLTAKNGFFSETNPSRSIPSTEGGRELHSNQTETLESTVSEITEEILVNQSISCSIGKDKIILTEIVHWMTDWETFYPSGYQDQFQQRVYELFNLALIEMLSARHSMRLKNSSVTAAMVFERLNERACFESYFVDLSEFMDPAMENYIRGAEKTEIKNPTLYMMACIWDAMQTGRVNQHFKVQY